MSSVTNVLCPLLALFLLGFYQAAHGVEDYSAKEIEEKIVHATTINPDNGKEIKLDLPELPYCWTRHYVTMTFDNKSHFAILSNDFDQEMVDPDHKEKNKTYTWIEARNACRRKCMELVTLDDPVKNKNLMLLLKGTDKTGVWTGGKRCVHRECKSVPKPAHLHGWYWSETGKMLNPANEIEKGWPENPWGQFGIMDTPQPDNAEHFKNESVIEACLAVKTAPKSRNPAWHDLRCDTKLGAVCEYSPVLRDFALRNSGIAKFREKFD